MTTVSRLLHQSLRYIGRMSQRFGSVRSLTFRCSMALRIAMIIALLIASAGMAAAATVKVGLLREGTLTAPIYIAKEKGYFMQEGIDCEF